MSWFVDIAGKAEDFLNKIDQNAAVALNTNSKEEPSRPKKTEPFLVPNPDDSNSQSTNQNNHVFPVTDYANANNSIGGFTTTTPTTVTVTKQNEGKSLKSKNFAKRQQQNRNQNQNQNLNRNHNQNLSSSSSSVKASLDSESFNNVTAASSNINSNSNSSKSVKVTVTQNGIDKRKNNGSGLVNGSADPDPTVPVPPSPTSKEDELIAYLNSSDASGLNESLILKDEVESQARELKLLTKNHRSLQKEHEELKKALEVYKEKLAAAESARSSNEAEEKDLRKLVEEKESEISSLSARHQQALEAIRKLEVSQENVQKLEQCLLENSQLKSENESLIQRTEMLASQVETAENHVTSMKATLASMEKEFTNYKEKAKSILSYKDELIASLKNNEDSNTPRSDASGGSANSPEELMAEITALKNDRELLQADLSQTRATVGSLKEENMRLEKEMDNLRCFTDDLSSQLKREKETVSNLQNENLQVSQQLSSLQFELEREKAEKKRSAGLVTKLKSVASSPKLGRDRDRDGEQNYENQNGGIATGTGEESYREVLKLKTRVGALSQSLYEKQSLINDLSTDKQLLQIEVERLKSELRESRQENNDFACQGSGLGGGLPQTVIASQPLYLSESPWDSRVSARVKRMYTQLDAVFCQFGLALRRRPNLRLGMSLYVIFLHLWVFFVLFSWMHHATPPPESANHTRAIVPHHHANVDVGGTPSNNLTKVVQEVLKI